MKVQITVNPKIWKSWEQFNRETLTHVIHAGTVRSIEENKIAIIADPQFTMGNLIDIFEESFGIRAEYSYGKCNIDVEYVRGDRKNPRPNRVLLAGVKSCKAHTYLRNGRPVDSADSDVNEVLTDNSNGECFDALNAQFGRHVDVTYTTVNLASRTLGAAEELCGGFFIRGTCFQLRIDPSALLLLQSLQGRIFSVNPALGTLHAACLPGTLIDALEPYFNVTAHFSGVNIIELKPKPARSTPPKPKECLYKGRPITYAVDNLTAGQHVDLYLLSESVLVYSRLSDVQICLQNHEQRLDLPLGGRKKQRRTITSKSKFKSRSRSKSNTKLRLRNVHKK